MSIYPSPKQHNGALNTIFNNRDYIQTNTGSTGLTITQTDAKYLQISGVTSSSAQTIFQNTVDFKSLVTVDNITANTLATFKNESITGNITDNVTGNITGNVDGNVSSTNIEVSDLATIDTLTVAKLLKSKQQTDTLITDVFRTDQIYSFTNGMVYSIISDSSTVNSVSFINIPTTVNQSYIFAFILQPSTANSPYYIRPSSNIVNVNGVSIPLYGLQRVWIFLFLNYLYSINYNLLSTKFYLHSLENLHHGG